MSAVGMCVCVWRGGGQCSLVPWCLVPPASDLAPHGELLPAHAIEAQQRQQRPAQRRVDQQGDDHKAGRVDGNLGLDLIGWVELVGSRWVGGASGASGKEGGGVRVCVCTVQYVANEPGQVGPGMDEHASMCVCVYVRAMCMHAGHPSSLPLQVARPCKTAPAQPPGPHTHTHTPGGLSRWSRRGWPRSGPAPATGCRAGRPLSQTQSPATTGPRPHVPRATPVGRVGWGGVRWG